MPIKFLNITAKRILRLFGVLIFTVLFASCGEEETTIPDGIMPRDSMAVVIADLHTLEAVMNARRQTTHPDSLNPYPMYKGVMESNGIYWNYFMRSYAFYLANPEDLLKVYEKAMVILTEKQAKLEANS